MKISIIRRSPMKQLWQHLSNQRKRQFLLLLMLMIIASLLEVVSLGAVLPFLGVLSTPDQVYEHSLMQPFIQALELTSSGQIILPLTIFFIISVLLAGLVRLLLLYTMTRFSYATGAELSIKIYKLTLYQEYSVHISRNSSEVINGIITKTNTVIGGVITPTLNLISSTILFIGIVSAMFIININIALSAIIGFGFLYWLVIRYTKAHLESNSLIIANQSTQMIKTLQEGLGGIRDVLIDGTQQFYYKLYRNADLKLRRASGDNKFISGSPRYVMESIGMTLIAILAYSMTQQEDSMEVVIPVLGALALGAQRLLPSLQQAYDAISTIKGASSSFNDVLNLLNQSLPEYANQPPGKLVVFEKNIKLKSVDFYYLKDSSWVLRNINLTIKKGDCIGFIGVTGSGKSTLLDIIMGLLMPTDGELIVDQRLINDSSRRAWQTHIAHVPQNIFLSDGTIQENIAFGIAKDKIDYQRVQKAARQAQLFELIEQWKDGYQTLVGEQGIRLSGGQRQRIGIARALYKEADVLILDEATSALDGKTEQAVMKSIKELGEELTILIIAHRVTTLKGCDQIVEMDNKKVLNVGSYDDIIEKNLNK